MSTQTNIHGVIGRETAENHILLHRLDRIEVGAVARVENRNGKLVLFDPKLLRAHLRKVAGLLYALEFQAVAPDEPLGGVNPDRGVQVTAGSLLGLNLVERRDQCRRIVRRAFLQVLDREGRRRGRGARQHDRVVVQFDKVAFGFLGKKHAGDGRSNQLADVETRVFSLDKLVGGL